MESSSTRPLSLAGSGRSLFCEYLAGALSGGRSMALTHSDYRLEKDFRAFILTRLSDATSRIA